MFRKRRKKREDKAVIVVYPKPWRPKNDIQAGRIVAEAIPRGISQ